MAKPQATFEELVAAVDAAASAASSYKPQGELETTHVGFVATLLADAKTRLAILPDLLHSAKLEQDVADAKRAYEAAQDAQRG